MTLAQGRGASPEDEADRLRARFEERDAWQIGELTEDARRIQEDGVTIEIFSCTPGAERKPDAT